MLARMILAALLGVSLFTAGCGDNDAGARRDGTPGASPSAADASVTPSTSRPAATPDAPTATCEPPYPSGKPTASNVFCADPASMQPVSVVRIVDGDTLRAIVDGVEEPVRLWGVDTPERGEECFDEATEVLRAFVAVNGGQIRLVTDARNRDTYDRLLRYVYTPDGLSIDAALIAGGYGYAWTRDGALRDALVDLEELARRDGRGCLWR